MGYSPAADDIVAERLVSGVYSVTAPTTCQYGKVLNDIQSKIHLVSSLSIPSPILPIQRLSGRHPNVVGQHLVSFPALALFYFGLSLRGRRPTLKKYQGEKVDKPLPVPQPPPPPT